MLSKTTLRQKLLLAFATILIIIIGTTAVNITQILSNNRIAQSIYAEGLIGMELLGDATVEASRIRENLVQLQQTESPEEVARRQQEIESRSAKLLNYMERYEALTTTAGEELALEDFYEEWDTFEADIEQVIQIMLAGNPEEANLIFQATASPNLEQAINYLLLLQDIEDNVYRAEFFRSRDIANRALNFSLLTLAAAIILSVGLAYWLARTVAAPITLIAKTADKIAAGDFTQTVPANLQSIELNILAEAMNKMAVQLHQSIGFLEQRVESRTRALEASIEVSRRLGTILDRRQLLSEVVHQVQATFQYYHAHIYLFNETEQKLEMAGGTGEAGRTMLAGGHSLRLEQGLVGRAATTREPVLIPDVTRDPNWLPNPLLPDTKAETAVPITYGNSLLGVLDVQHDIVDGLSEEDVSLLESVASQVGIALHNARLYEQVEQRARQEAVVNKIGQQIRSAQDIETILQIAARELGTVLQAEQTQVQLGARANGHKEGIL